MHAFVFSFFLSSFDRVPASWILMKNKYKGSLYLTKKQQQYQLQPNKIVMRLKNAGKAIVKEKATEIVLK